MSLLSAKERIVQPKSLLTSVFAVTNSGAKEDIYQLKAIVPEEWHIISSLPILSLQPGEIKHVPLTVSVPIIAMTDRSYQVGLIAVSEKDPEIKAQSAAIVKVLPHARLKIIAPEPRTKATPGQAIAYTFTILNLGNGKDIFKITAKSAHGEKVVVSIDNLELGIGEQGDVPVTIRIPLDVSGNTSHFLTLKAESTLLEKGVYEESNVHTPITAANVRQEGLYKKLPAQATFYLAGVGTREALGPQMSFYTSGDIGEKHWIDFSCMGPYYKDRENYKGISEEKLTMKFGSDYWDVGMGDIAASLSELTVSSISEEGIRLRGHSDSFSALFFNMEKKQTGFQEALSGARLTYDINKSTEIGVNYFQSDEDKLDLSSARSAEEKKMASVSALYNLKGVMLRGEYAGSEFNDGSGQKDDDAWWMSSRLKKEKFYIDTEYICSGSEYPGRRKDMDGYRFYASYNVIEPVWMWVHNSKNTNNLNSDPTKATDDKDAIEVGAFLTIERLPFLSLSYETSKSESKQQQILLSDSKEDSIMFRASDTYGPYAISFDFKWTDEKDDIKIVDTQRVDYTARAYGRWEKFSSWVGYGYNVDEDMTTSADTVFLRKEMGFMYQPGPDISAYLSFSQEGDSNDVTADILSMNIYYDAWEGASFSLEGEMRDDDTAYDKDWEFWLAFTQDFDLPFPFIKTRGALEGNVFIDENNNGIMDKGEHGAPNIIFKAQDKKSTTNKKGRFKLSSLIPGEEELEMEISSLPVGLIPAGKMPLKVKIKKGKVERIDIPLVRTCKIRGFMFEDIDKNVQKGEDEKGIALTRVVLVRDGFVFRDTFTDADGRYSFTGILPGEYSLAIDEEWLPVRHRLTTVASYEVELEPSQEIVNMNFGSVEKEKKIIKTYTAPKVETVYVEKEKPSPLRHLFVLLFLGLLLLGIFIVILLIYNMIKRP